MTGLAAAVHFGTDVREKHSQVSRSIRHPQQHLHRKTQLPVQV